MCFAFVVILASCKYFFFPLTDTFSHVCVPDQTIMKIDRSKLKKSSSEVV